MADEQNYIVYKHTCPNGKCYIGLTGTSLEKRSGHNGYNYCKNTFFYRAILKYGWDNIRHEILFDNLTKEQAEQREIEMIAKFKSNQKEFGYNISIGGESGNAGVIASEETRKKMSIAHMGNPSNTGRKLTEEHRKKLSEAHKGNKVMLGRKLSQETRQKMSEAQKGEKNHRYGKHHSQEAMEKIMAYVNSRDYYGAKNPKAKTVFQYSADGELIKTWDCIKDASAFLGISHSYLIKIMKTHKLYHNSFWSYEEVM